MLSQAEIDALLASPLPADDQPPQLAPDGRIVKPYDFRKPAKFSSEQMRTLNAIHETVGRVASARLGSFLRAPVPILLADTQQLTFEDYLGDLNIPTQLVVMASSGLGGPFMLNLDLGFALAAVDRLLGGTGNVSGDRRDPTPIETDLIGRVVAHLPAALNEGWSHLQALDVAITETALTPILLRVAAPTEVVAVMFYEMRFANVTAQMTICYPYASLEPLLPRLAATMWYAQRRQVDAHAACRQTLENEVRSVEIAVTAALRSIELPLESLSELRPGDIIRFDERFDDPVTVDIASQARALAIPGRVGDRLALRLVTPLDSMEA